MKNSLANSENIRLMLRNESISSLAQKLRAIPDIDLSYVAAFAISEWAEQAIQWRQERLQFLEENVATSEKLAAAYHEFFDLLKDPSLRGYLNAKAKLAKDPKQSARAAVKTLWLERRAGKHPRLRTNEQFAIEAVRRWNILKNGTVLKWCTAWEKEMKSTSPS